MVVPSLLLSVGLLSAAVALILHDLSSFYAHVLGKLTSVPLADRLADGSLGLRPYFLAFLFLLSCFAVGSLRQRLRLLLFSWTLYIGGILLLDVSQIGRAHV